MSNLRPGAPAAKDLLDRVAEDDDDIRTSTADSHAGGGVRGEGLRVRVYRRE